MSESNGITLAVIPARGGSKRLPGKNIRELGGRPLICHAITAALQAACIDKVLVTSDTKEIIEVARTCGAEAPFIRPEHLATDEATSLDTFRHAVSYIEEQGTMISTAILLQPTSPFTTADLITRCVTLLRTEQFDSVLTMRQVHPGIEHMGSIASSGKFNSVTHSLPYGAQSYTPSGNVYVLTNEYLKTCTAIVGENTGAVIANEKEAIDIDHLEDFLLAEAVLQNGSK